MRDDMKYDDILDAVGLTGDTAIQADAEMMDALRALRRAVIMTPDAPWVPDLRQGYENMRDAARRAWEHHNDWRTNAGMWLVEIPETVEV